MRAMPNLADTLKAEIARVARKELKGEVQFLRKAVAHHRSEIAALKREIKALQSSGRQLGRRLQQPPAAAAQPAPAAAAPRRRGRQPAPYSAEAFAATRRRLGLTQAQMAQLLGVSPLSIYKWESGQVMPRAAQLAKIAGLKKMGVREARRRLAEAA